MPSVDCLSVVACPRLWGARAPRGHSSAAPGRVRLKLSLRCPSTCRLLPPQAPASQSSVSAMSSFSASAANRRRLSHTHTRQAAVCLLNLHSSD